MRHKVIEAFLFSVAMALIVILVHGISKNDEDNHNRKGFFSFKHESERNEIKAHKD